ncbi:hypothetical protein FA13DRAFT_1708348 [Coprinellus micaceus]|uniref:Uncharacterized protein n=1 Tax=Coprinellus micaceus TaxID=71717 RepID=A0A4Y7THD2_COPMI|nr:hypothetical protein FA13DRAFT_1708348 [Coprinellus micaceus]
MTFLLSATFLLSTMFLLPGVLSFGLHLDRKLFVVTVLAIWAALGIGICIDMRRGGRCRIVTGQTSARRNEARSRVRGDVRRIRKFDGNPSSINARTGAGTEWWSGLWWSSMRLSTPGDNKARSAKAGQSRSEVADLRIPCRGRAEHIGAPDCERLSQLVTLRFYIGAPLSA